MALATLPTAGTEIDDDVFGRLGFIGSVRLLDDCECRSAVWHLRRNHRPPAVHWSKGRAVTDRFMFNVARSPRILSRVRKILGNDIILWGATEVVRRPGESHIWHTDIESSDPKGGFVSVWIGIENTSVESGLQLVSGSHLFGKTIQQVAHEKGVNRSEVTSREARRWAAEIDGEAVLHQPDVEDGVGIIFDGRTWHGSTNTRVSGTRTALLLQYARSDVPVREPDLRQREWPFRFFEDRRPPVVRVSGAPPKDVNWVFDPPSVSGPSGHLPPMVVPVCLPLAEDANKFKRSYPLYDGPTPVMKRLGCHVSVLSPGQMPHEPHSHGEEELLIVLEGEGELVITDSPELEAVRSERLGPGSFVYYPAWQHHTIRNRTDAPVTYLMLRWFAAGLATGAPLGVRIVRPTDDKGPDINHSTDYLGRLHFHMTVMAPGKGYDPHVDDYDVAIILLEGQIEIFDETVGPCAAIFCPAGEPHGMRSVGEVPARYLVFEFHKSTPNAPRQGIWGALRRAFQPRNH